MTLARLLFAAALGLAGTTAGARTEGWTGENPVRAYPPAAKELWTADLATARADFREGAEGTMRLVDGALEIVKTNDRGLIVVTAPAFDVKPAAKLRVTALCSCSNGDSEAGEGYLRLWGKTEDLTYFKGLDGRGPGGPAMQKMVNSPKDGSIRKIAHRLADEQTGTRITPAIVVSGPASTSRWSAWRVEDKTAADKAWAAARKKLEPCDMTAGAQDAATFARELAADRDHTAAVTNVNGVTRLLIDGLETAPVIFRGQTSKEGKITFAGGLHDARGLRLQSMTLRFGWNPKNAEGIWTKDGFDVKAGAEIVRTTMRLAPHSNFILTINVSGYPEWCEKHPGEEWQLADGRKVYGQQVHADFWVRAEKPADKWYWPSYHSPVWRAEVRQNLTALFDELRRQGLLKRVVGVHIAGYHDAQFATRHPDFSPAAVAAFQAWQRRKYGEVKWVAAPVFGKAKTFDPTKDAHQIAYLTFVKQGPFHMQEDLARHIRACCAKPIVIGRYCMGWGSAAFNTALDLQPFLESKDFDFLVAQPNYAYRIPGVAIGARIPTASFHRHGKLFVNEFDLRTYGGVAGEAELRVLGLSQAQDFPMWETIHRKLAGQMIAQRMGWWYLDMSGRWFSPTEIADDIGRVNAQYPSLAAIDAAWDAWRPSVAIALDEEGMLRRNSITHYYAPEERRIHEQIRSFAGAGIPVEIWSARDLIDNPKLVKHCKIVFFAHLDRNEPARRAMLAKLEKQGTRCDFLTSESPLSVADYIARVRAADGYAPASNGLQVDMSGSFISVHALRDGHWDFKLPRAAAVYNVKTGRCEANGEMLPLDLTVGETCWFILGPERREPTNVAAIDAKDWKERRAEVRALFEREEFGRAPAVPAGDIRFATAPDRPIMNGKGIHRAVTISAKGPRGAFSFDAHAYLPAGRSSVRSFIYIHLGQRVRNEGFVATADWPCAWSIPVADILARGYGVVSFNNWNVAMDAKTNCFETGVFAAFGPRESERQPTDGGAIAAWAWGASRVLDWIATQPDMDARHVAVVGHSRGGKTALWAGANDERFALTCVNDSGCSGAKLNAVDLPASESIERINAVFPHWFALNYRKWGARLADCPFDQHLLVALVAPRPVAIASATGDNWAGQPGEFASARLASPAWEAYGKKGLVAPDGLPSPLVPLQEGMVSYHIRSGKHDLVQYDWARYMDFADRQWGAP